MPLALQHVGPVDAGCGNTDQDFARPRDRHWPLDRDQDLGSTGPADLDGRHAVAPFAAQAATSKPVLRVAGGGARNGCLAPVLTWASTSSSCDRNRPRLRPPVWADCHQHRAADHGEGERRQAEPPPSDRPPFVLAQFSDGTAGIHQQQFAA